MFIDFPEVHTPVQGLEDVSLPEMICIRQSYDSFKIENAAEYLRKKLDKGMETPERLRGKRICITVGSRGIPELDSMVRTICDWLKQQGAEPFIIPSMGSHGGASAQGQLEVLEGYGITEQAMGVPILSCMEVEQYGTLEDIPLYCDKYAMHADGIVVFNKVKPHTEFRGEHESGLCKMIAIGLAKHKGAAMFHSLGFHRFAELIPQVAQSFLDTGKVVFGVGVIQNAYDDICDIEVCMPEKLIETEKRMLVVAKEKIAKFLFNDIDVLIIDEIGKNISGNGHDPNVTGRNLAGNFSDQLNLKKLFIRGITPESHHHGSGLGSADITTRRCLNSVDWEVTWTNCMTTGVLTGGSIPLYVNTDREAVLICLKTLAGQDPARARVVRIKNTLCLQEIQVSKALYESIRNYPGISLISGPEQMKFDDDGMLI